MLDVGDGHQVYWETCGDPQGIPAVYLHGGPGAGASAGQRRLFDPEVYRTLIFDQRGSGRSRPLASDRDADLGSNTTQHLISDIEALRELHRVDAWTVLGISWGSTLGLAYAQAHPKRVAAMVLGLVTTTSRREVEWITEGVGRIFPREWERFAAFVPEGMRGARLVDAYAQLLFDDDAAVRHDAAREWCLWEDAHVSLAPGHRPNPSYANAEFRMRFARLVTHYWSHGAFYGEDELLLGSASLDGIPGALIHGRYDVSSPLEVAWEIAKLWKSARLHVMNDAGHGGSRLPGLIAESLDSLARR